jgi:type II secretory pathway component GspD/PulD (secretin)
MALAAALGVLAAAAGAQQALEIIPLRHRAVEQVLPALQPLLEPGATLSGSRGQLFLRASPANADEIKRALQAIDQPARRLQISVRFAGSRERSRRTLGASGSIGSGGTRVDITAQDRRTNAAERVDQRIQVLEGSRAFIHDDVTGFEVIARIAGQRALLEIAPQRRAQALVTTIEAPIGEWVELGGSGESRGVWVKVEALD